MHSTVIAILSIAAAATATVNARADYGGWNVTLSHTGGNGKQRMETVSGIHANSGFAENVPAICHYQGMLDGEVVDKTICDPEFKYVLESAGDNDGNLYHKF